jgi:hypothetical protein
VWPIRRYSTQDSYYMWSDPPAVHYSHTRTPTALTSPTPRVAKLMDTSRRIRGEILERPSCSPDLVLDCDFHTFGASEEAVKRFQSDDKCSRPSTVQGSLRSKRFNFVLGDSVFMLILCDWEK